jgi:hypothetical protein
MHSGFFISSQNSVNQLIKFTFRADFYLLLIAFLAIVAVSFHLTFRS